MGEEELLDTWANTLYDKVKAAKTEVEVLKALKEVLHSVFLVGIEAGKDQEKMAGQLQKLGEPYGFTTP